MSIAEIIFAVIAGLFALIGFLLKMQVARIQSDISETKINLEKKADATRVDKLFSLHDSDAKELEEHKLLIAKRHYERPEIDNKIDKIEAAIKDGFKELNLSVKEMAHSMNAIYADHIKTHHSKDNQ